MNDDTLTPNAILERLDTNKLPGMVLCYKSIGSTMDVAREWLQHIPDPEVDVPALILAEEQTSGRGRLKRQWVAPAGSALLFSLAIRPGCLTPAEAPTQVWMAGVALCEGITEVTGLAPRLKWPNDVILTSSTPPAKIAGILLESGSLGNKIEWAVLGCGLNVNAAPPADTNLRYPTSSLSEALGQPVPRLPLICAIITRLDYWYSRLRRGQRQQLFTSWRALLHTIGQEITIHTDSGPLTGYVEDVEPNGALRLRDQEGTLHSITSGDVGPHQ